MFLNFLKLAGCCANLVVEVDELKGRNRWNFRSFGKLLPNVAETPVKSLWHCASIFGGHSVKQDQPVRVRIDIIDTVVNEENTGTIERNSNGLILQNTLFLMIGEAIVGIWVTGR